MEKIRLLLTRHGETLENRENILQGHLPGTLSPVGIKQAEALAEMLKTTALDVVVCSDLARSVDTAAIIAAPHGLVPVQTPVLREMDWGKFTGGQLDDLDWYHLPESVESLPALYERAGQFVEWLQRHFPGKQVLAVGHGAVNRAIVAFLEGREPLDMLRMPIMENTSLVTFELERCREGKLFAGVGRLSDSEQLSGSEQLSNPERLSGPVPEPESLLLHTCCAPCSAAIIEWLLEHHIRPILFFYNPNIYPEEEYLKRKTECMRYAATLGLEIIDGDYQHQQWLEEMAGLEAEPERGKRCLYCFKTRLLATAQLAAERNVSRFATTLASSRWKSLEQIAEAGHWAAGQVSGTTFWDRNWRKEGLSERRRILLAQNGFYNQTYCGCEFSRNAD